MRNHIVLLLLLFSLLPVCASAESLSLAEMAAAEDAASLSSDLSAPETVQTVSTAAREAFIDRILSLPDALYKGQRSTPARAIQRRHLHLQKLHGSSFPRNLRRLPHGRIPRRTVGHPKQPEESGLRSLRLRGGMAGCARQRRQSILRCCKLPIR